MFGNQTKKVDIRKTICKKAKSFKIKKVLILPVNKKLI
jgi:hypothetical protein